MAQLNLERLTKKEMESIAFDVFKWYGTYTAVAEYLDLNGHQAMRLVQNAIEREREGKW